MRLRTARFDAVAASGEQTQRCRADLLYAGQLIESDLAIVDGEINFDASNAVMAQGHIQLAEPTRVPSAISNGTLTPFGFELAIYGGAVYSDGTEELLPLGVFPIQKAGFDGETLAADIELADRMQWVIDARLEEDYPIAAATNYASAIQALIADGVPGLTYRFASTPYTTPFGLVVPAQADRSEEALKMAKAIGCRLFFDGLGECVLTPEPQTDGVTALWVLSDGDGGLLSATRVELDREKAYSRTVAFGQNPAISGAVPRGVATDDDPSSPTYYFGPFGHKPRFYSSEYITTDAQAGQAAQAIQAQGSGVARGMSIEFVPNYALEPLDPILVSWSPLGINELHFLEAFTLPIIPNAAAA